MSHWLSISSFLAKNVLHFAANVGHNIGRERWRAMADDGSGPITMVAVGGCHEVAAASAN
jgi:hypothetical protein